MSNELTGAKILIVDDQPTNLDLLIKALEPHGYDILSAPSGEIAIRIASRFFPDLILLDILMPEMDGYQVCHRLKQNASTQHIPIIFVTAKDEMSDLVEGFRIGGVDYITKPFQHEELLARVETHVKINRLTQELARKNRELENEIAKREQEEKARHQAEEALMKADEELSMISDIEASHWGIAGFVGKSKTVQKILAEIRQLRHTGTTSVLITGESGTGKELIARAIHSGSPRAKQKFLPLNCSAIPAELAELTLFGHVRGAFTGANTSRTGYFELANGGTLFLDEIGDMPVELQTKLLRVLEDGRFIPVGGVDEKSVDVRIISATNANLHHKIAEGQFREDLYFRLAGFHVLVPPLRERKEDIPLLVDHFLKMFASDMGITNPTMGEAALEALMGYHFPGNIRELKHIIEGALILSREAPIQPENLHFIDVSPPDVSHASPSQATPQNHDEPEQLEALMLSRAQVASEGTGDDEKRILAYIRQHGSINNAECRELLSVDRNRAAHLLKKMHAYGLLILDGERRWSRYRRA